MTTLMLDLSHQKLAGSGGECERCQFQGTAACWRSISWRMCQTNFQQFLCSEQIFNNFCVYGHISCGQVTKQHKQHDKSHFSSLKFQSPVCENTPDVVQCSTKSFVFPSTAARSCWDGISGRTEGDFA